MILTAPLLWSILVNLCCTAALIFVANIFSCCWYQSPSPHDHIPSHNASDIQQYKILSTKNLPRQPASISGLIRRGQNFMTTTVVGCVPCHKLSIITINIVSSIIYDQAINYQLNCTTSPLSPIIVDAGSNLFMSSSRHLPSQQRQQIFLCQIFSEYFTNKCFSPLLSTLSDWASLKELAAPIHSQ